MATRNRTSVESGEILDSTPEISIPAEDLGKFVADLAQTLNKQTPLTNEQKMHVELTALEKNKTVLHRAFLQEEKVPVVMAPLYQPYFGRVMALIVNGIGVFLPVDGKRYMIPKSFADEADRQRMAVDALLETQNRLADVANNVETAPGVLQLI